MTVNTIPRAEAHRVERFLADLGDIGRDPRGGWSRLAFSAPEREAHSLFARTMAELGLAVRTDAIGNTIAELPGREPGPALVTGSHLDTVPQGGNFDGAAGVAAAVEVAHLLAETSGLRRPFQAVAFAAEEGARFGAPCIGSRVATGAFTAETLRGLLDTGGRSVTECAKEVGLRPDDVAAGVWQPGSIAAFLELHIEQGRVLEERGRPLGIVHSIGGSTRVELTFSGRADHSGATPMWLRQDALAGAGEFVVEVERRAALHPTTVATVGRLEVMPGSLTTVPGTVVLGLDVRDVDSERQRELTESLLDEAARIAARRQLQLGAELLSDQSPVVLHKTVQDQLAFAAGRLGIRFAVLASGASHDAAHIVKLAPTGMVFVPSREGVSHAPDEWSDPEDIARGAEVVGHAMKALDEQDMV